MDRSHSRWSRDGQSVAAIDVPCRGLARLPRVTRGEVEAAALALRLDNVCLRRPAACITAGL